MPWRGFAVGQTNDKLSPGIRETLVARGFAVWVEPPLNLNAIPPTETEPDRKAKGKRRD